MVVRGEVTRMEEADNIASALRALYLFNEKADKLEKLRFTKRITSDETSVTVHFRAEGGITGERDGPDDESIDAFVLTFRFFIQDNEPTSIRKMDRMYEELRETSLLSKSLVEDFSEVRKVLNGFLNENTQMHYFGKTITRRDVYEVFMWGGLAHANEQKKAVYDEWQSLPFLFSMLEHEFVRVLVTYLKGIFFMRRLNKKAIEELQAQS